jgi:hypothetical protein
LGLMVQYNPFKNVIMRSQLLSIRQVSRLKISSAGDAA